MDPRGRAGVCIATLLSVVVFAYFRQTVSDSSWLSATHSNLLFSNLRQSSTDGGHAEFEHQKRRSLATSDSVLYITYAALTAGNVPCNPQTGYSYYTPNCKSATGPAAPYTRGCTTIGNCARV